MKKTYLPVMALLLVTSLGFAAHAHAEDAINTQINTSANVNVGGMMGAPRMRFGGADNQGENGKGHGSVYGSVTSVGATSLTLTNKQTGTVYTVDSTNAKIDKNRTAISLSGITVGDTVFVEGTVNGTAVVATAIHDGVMLKGGAPGGNPMPGVAGTVTAVSGNTITISSKKWTSGTTTTASSVTYTIDATNASVMKNGVASSVSGIAVGDVVNAQGTINGTSVVATKINDGKMMRAESGQQSGFPEGNGQPMIGGTVTAISGNTITITNKSNVAYTIDATNAKVTKGNTATTTSTIAVGDALVVQGAVNGTAVNAVTINDQGVVQASAPAPQGFFGRIGGFFAHLFGF